MKQGFRIHLRTSLVVAIALVIQSQATDFYVDTSNPSAADSNPGTVTLPWKTITKANQTLVAGDTVFVRGGIYTSYVSPTASGTAAKPITYRNYGTDNVTVSNTTAAVQLSGNSCIIVQGINFLNCDYFLYFVGATHNTIAYCTFDRNRGTSMWTGSTIEKSSQYNWIHHCTFSNFGWYTSSTASGTDFWIGDDASTTDHSDYNLVENNVMFHGGHDVMTVSGSHNVIRNNYFHNENWSSGSGERCLMFMGHDEVATRNLIEGNRIAFSGYPPSGIGAGASGMSLASRSNIVRLNCFYACNECGLAMGTTGNYPTSPCYNRIYNNTFYTNGFSTISPTEARAGLGMGNYGNPQSIAGNAIKNNIFYRNTAVFGTYAVNLSDQIIAGNWMQTGDPRFVDISTAMNVTNASIPDLQLRTNSPCIDAGVFLTTITSASGSGRSFQLADATYFMDGWGIVPGDLIGLQGSAQKARMTNVNYTTGTVIVDSSVTWTQNQGIALAYEGSAPDMGAFEYKPTGQTAPLISLSPSSLVFATVLGGAESETQLVSVVNGGTTDVLTWTQSDNMPWLQVSPAGGTTPGSLRVSANTTGLATGTYTGTITIVAPAASNSPQTVAVSLQITQPVISLSPASLSFAAVPGGAAPSPQAVSVVNGGTTWALNWTQSDNAAWLQVSPTNGVTPGTLTVSVNSAGLAVGSYAATITVNAPAAANTPQTLSVSLAISTGPQLTGHFEMTYPNRASFLAAGWDFLARTASGATRNTEQTSGAVVSFDQAAHPGILRLPDDTGDLWENYYNNDTKNTLFRDLPGTWTSVRLRLAAFNPTQSSQQAGVVVYQDDDNYIQVYRIYENGNYVGLVRETGGSASVVQFVPQTATSNIYMRLDRDPATQNIIGYYSLNGTNWTSLGSVTQALTNSRLGIVVTGSPSGLPNADVAWAEVYSIPPPARCAKSPNGPQVGTVGRTGARKFCFHGSV